MKTDEEAARQIDSLSATRDTDSAHWEADKLLCELLRDFDYSKTAEAFENMEKWYS